MTRTLIVCGHGPGISDAVARRFGKEGFQVALVARNEERLTKAAAALAEQGITAKAFPCDLGDAKAVRKMVGDVRSALGPITTIHYNAYAGGAGDLLSCDTDELHKVLAVSVDGLIVTVQEALADLESQDKSAVLVTGGGFAFYDPNVDAMAVQFNAMGLAIAKAAQHKAVGLLTKRLSANDIYVGEVVVLGMVKGTAFDCGQATLDAADIADQFWTLHESRSPSSVSFPAS